MEVKLKNIPKQLFVSHIISTCKKGNVSSEFILKVITAINNDMELGISLSADFITFIRHVYGDYCNEFTAENILNRWKSLLPSKSSLRLRLTTEQAKCGGVTVAATVMKAIETYSDFDWIKIFSLFPSEAAVVAHAIQKIKENPFVGFSRNLEEISSTKYKSIGYIAKELLIKGNLPDTRSLSAYRGWPSTIPYKKMIDEMILKNVEGKDIHQIDLFQQHTSIDIFNRIQSILNNATRD